ncbi:MAG TPA: ribonuclease III [Candidatus Polarisedimenticolia bacterium]|jgi:ribonuclease-3
MVPGRKARHQTESRPQGEPLEDLEKSLGHRFSRRDLLERALVHRSWAYEKGTAGRHSESLEFLGDAVLSLSVSRMLLERFGEQEVGDLAHARAFLVSETNLARKARALKIGAHLRLGRGEERGGGREKDSLLADAFEAVLAAIYLDGGFDPAHDLIARQFSAQIARLATGQRTAQDHKTDLQEALQAVGLPVPVYRVSAESGPDHRKEFSVELRISDRTVARGSGTSKKGAEQEAARKAFRRIDRLIARFTAPALEGEEAEGKGARRAEPEPRAPRPPGARRS